MTSDSGENQPSQGNDLPTAAYDSDARKHDRDGSAQSFDATIAANESVLSGRAGNTDSVKRPQIDGYELVDELGRGGMGVVYRAHHKKLDRTVAIKMILAGQFASPESIARFQLEAETAARLDHPGIVPIYEIGQAGENHFFSMKLIDGSPLSTLLERYQADQQQSARLMIKIADAVQHAHQRGVLHRDLKPANVLIDGDGQPLLTDLGLAKRLDDDTAMTQTGLVLGSPGFMSPEQAEGKTDVTVAADVYAMGAILYWLIAGQAPVTGESAFEIVRKTIEHEPPSLRELRTDADRDLNLICSKALEKDPTQRYTSAAAFSSDLQAWLEGEPLSVKPPTLLTSARRWIHRNFRGVAVGVGAGMFCGLWMGFTILLQIAEAQISQASELHERLGASELPWITQAFSWVNQFPEGLRESLPMWITVVSAVCGLATIGFSKPKRGESGVAAALTAALLSGILAFVISWAWAPIANSTQHAASEDLQLLTDYLFLHPEDRELAENVLFERYPGLPGADTWERSDLLRAKIGNDQTSSIPKAIWTGMIVTIFLAALPLFVSSLLANVIWQRETRGWGFFWRSLEISFYATTLLFLLCRSLSTFVGAPPLPIFQLISTVVMLTSIVVALKCKPFWMRVPFFLLVLFTFGINMDDGSKVTRSRWMAQAAQSDAQLAEIAPYMERLVALHGNREDMFRLATVYAYFGQDAKYKRMCERLLQHRNYYQRRVAEQASKAMLLKPSVHDDPNVAYRLAKLASEQRGFNGWDYLARSLSEYRQGEMESTAQWSEKAIDAASVTGRLKRDHRWALLVPFEFGGRDFGDWSPVL